MLYSLMSTFCFLYKTKKYDQILVWLHHTEKRSIPLVSSLLTVEIQIEGEIHF